MEISDGGIVTAEQVYIGSEDEDDNGMQLDTPVGHVVIRGENSKLTSNGSINIGGDGEGLLTIEEKAIATASENVTVGSLGKIDLQGGELKVRQGDNLGTIILNARSDISPPQQSDAQDQPEPHPGTLTGQGIIEGNLVNSGEISIAPDFVNLDNDARHRSDHDRVIHLKGNYTQNPEGVLTIQINERARSADNDQSHPVNHFLFIEGDATLDGTLKVEAAEGYEFNSEEPGNRYRVLTATGTIGATEFAKFDPIIPGNKDLFFALDYRDKDVARGDEVRDDGVEVITLKVPRRPISSFNRLTDMPQSRNLVLVTHGTNDSVIDGQTNQVQRGVSNQSTGALVNNQLAAIAPGAWGYV